MFRLKRQQRQAESTRVGLARRSLRHGVAGLAAALLIGGAGAQAAEAVDSVDHLAPLPSRELGRIAGGATPTGPLPMTSGVPKVAVILWDEAGKRNHQGMSSSPEVTRVASGLLVLKLPTTR